MKRICHGVGGRRAGWGGVNLVARECEQGKGWDWRGLGCGLFDSVNNLRRKCARKQWECGKLPSVSGWKAGYSRNLKTGQSRGGWRC